MTELIPIVAAYATPTQGAGPMLVTLKAGLFEKHGLAVEAQDRGRAQNVVAGLMAGELQFGNLAAPSMLRMVLNGEADIVFLALGINQQFLVSRPGVAHKKDLAGARLARSGDGAITDLLTLFLHEQLGQAGMPPGYRLSRLWAQLLARGNRGAAQLCRGAPGHCPGVHRRLYRGAASLPERSRVHGECAA